MDETAIKLKLEQATRDKVIALFASGIPAYEIGQRLRMSVTAINGILERNSEIVALRKLDYNNRRLDGSPMPKKGDSDV